MASFYLFIFMKQNAGTFWEDERLSAAADITQKVAILQMKIIPTAGGKDKMKPCSPRRIFCLLFLIKPT
jgi:hypothetical protein